MKDDIILFIVVLVLSFFLGCQTGVIENKSRLGEVQKKQILKMSQMLPLDKFPWVDKKSILESVEGNDETFSSM
jgi:hypothetical protein